MTDDQMRSDLERLARRDGCIAAGWALSEIDRLGRCNEQLAHSNAEVLNAKHDWSYDELETILRDELPLTMTLGLAVVLVERMVRERMFQDRISGVVDAMTCAANQALEVSDE